MTKSAIVSKIWNLAKDYEPASILLEEIKNCKE
jgi:hypothetical protein